MCYHSVSPLTGITNTQGQLEYFPAAYFNRATQVPILQLILNWALLVKAGELLLPLQDGDLTACRDGGVVNFQLPKVLRI